MKKFYEVSYNALGMGEEKSVIFTDKEDAAEFQDALDNNGYLTNWFTYEIDENDEEEIDEYESHAEWDAAQTIPDMLAELN